VDSAELFRKVRERGVANLGDGGLQLVLGLDSAAFLGLRVASQVVRPLVINQAFRLAERSKPIQGLIMYSGPREDGVTANAGRFFVGGEGVSVADGAPLEPGMTLSIDALDLSHIHVVATDIADRLRMLYLA
jgi:hypothetical protein